MDIGTIQIVSTLLYKLACIGAGGTFVWLGYRLFVRGIVASAGEMKISRGEDKGGKGEFLTLKNAAPGTFFSVLGALVIAATVGTGFHTDAGATVTPMSNVASISTGIDCDPKYQSSCVATG